MVFFCLDYVDDLRDGIFTEDDQLKCYINCMLDMLNITKNGKINYGAAMRHIEMLVPKHLKVSKIDIIWVPPLLYFKNTEFIDFKETFGMNHLFSFAKKWNKVTLHLQ